jgi:hypothetical protein
MTIANNIRGLLLAILSAGMMPAQGAQSFYPTPEAAAAAFIEMTNAPTPEGLSALLGDHYQELGSGDPVADRQDLSKLAEAAADGTRIDQLDDAIAILLIGKDDWPLPIPLVREEAGWRFDSAAGKDEVISRHIGRGELHAIATLRALVDAQMEYRQKGLGGGAFAQRFASNEGKRDGLYWPVAEGAEPSPLGPLVAEAEKSGYEEPRQSGRTPYYGYYFRILTAQGPHAPGGQQDYLDKGRLTGGFAAIAFPADYGNSGIKSFIVNARGIIFEKDLGPTTLDLADKMSAFDPDPSWVPAEDPTL